MTPERVKVVGQYLVFRLKLIEVLHLMLLSFHLLDTKIAPANTLGHESERFRESLLGATITIFMSICDGPESTNARKIWRKLHASEADEIDQFWTDNISPGEEVMKLYRNRAGAHGDQPSKFFAAKIELIQKKQLVFEALDAFLALATCLLKKEADTIPELASEIEQVLLDIELKFPNGSFNRRWLREMKLVESGSYRKVFH